MQDLRVWLFGRVSVRSAGQPVSDLSAKALELLCYLLLYRDRAHARETLSALLWPDTSYAVAKKYLRQTLWQLQSALPGDALLILNPGWVRADPDGSWWLDVAEFETAYRACRDIPGEELTGPQAETLEAAVRLYRGELIEGWYQDWCIYERDRLQLTYLAMLEKLMVRCVATGAYAKGIGYGQGILRDEPTREAAHRHLMVLYYLSGDRSTALRQYERCVAALAREFDLRPSRETEDLYQQIRAERLLGPAAAAVPPPVPAGDPGLDLLVDLGRRLDHMQYTLNGVQARLRRHLGVITPGT
jgi:DNA-binding SARP family transcriptional activator